MKTVFCKQLQRDCIDLGDWSNPHELLYCKRSELVAERQRYNLKNLEREKMLGKFELLAGDFDPKGMHQFLNDKLHLTKQKEERRFFSQSQTYNVSDIEELQQLDEEELRTAGGTLGWGLVGVAVAGPLGALAGGYLGGKKDRVVFACKFKDGRKFLGAMKKRQFEKLNAPFVLNSI